MKTISELFQQAQLAEAAYANLTSAIGNQTALKQALDVINKDSFGGSFSASQAADFVTHWTVVDQYTAPSAILGIGGTGFSATLFKNSQTGAYSFAIRGTEFGYADLLGADFGDIVMDGIAMDQVVDMYNYWQSLNYSGNYQAAKLETSWTETAALKLMPPGVLYDAAVATLKASGAILDTTLGGTLVRRIVLGDSTTLLADTALAQGSGKLAACPALDVTGHSLGGHLAAAFTRLFPGSGASAITVNGAGFPTGLTPGLGGSALSNINNLFYKLGGAAAFDPARIQNVYGDGPTMVTMNSQYGLVQPGSAPLEIHIETMDAGTTIGHGAGQMTDSLALYNLFAKLDPSLNADQAGLTKITDILKASSNVAANSLESALAAVGKIYGKSYSAIETNRDDLYKHLNELQTAITVTGTVVAISGDVSGQAKTDIAYRYALKELNPFALTGVSYSAFNTGGSLDLYDPATGTGTLTTDYLTDRAAMLAWKIKLATEDYVASANNPYHDAPNYYYKDVKSGEEIYLGNPAMGQMDRRFILFGDEQPNTLNGSSQNDRLYGMGGNDTLNGGSGNDYIEGGKGADTLNGGAGNDTLDGLDGQGGDTLSGGIGNDTYYADNGDIIYDEDGIGTVYVGKNKTRLTGGERKDGEPFFYSADKTQAYRENADGSIDAWTPDGHVTVRPSPGTPGPRAQPASDGSPGTQSGQPGMGVPLFAPKPKDPPISPDTNGSFNGARTYVPPRRDPLALDLDRDGIETIGANGMVLFDHDGDGIKTGTGWVGADDGLLVLDRNGNGQIDTGAELFGVDTVLANGQKASDGFAALRDLDANGDGVFDARDARFANVRVWRDLNQNGAAQAGELFTLQTLGITAINLNATAKMVNLGNGNVQTATASYVLADGTTGAAAGVGLGQTAANLEFAVNPFYRQFTDPIPLSEQASLLPQMQGSGRVRDLREAVSLSPELAASVSAYAQQSTRAGQLDLIGDVLDTWGATSGMATSVEQASTLGYRLIYLDQGQFMTEHESLLPYWDADESGLAGLTAEQRQTLAQIKAQQSEITQRIGTLERFNGMNFVTVDASGVTTGQGWRRDAETTPGADGVRRVYVSLMDGQNFLLDAGYRSLKESVYSGLALQTRLKPYLDAVALQLDTGGLHLDFAGVTAALVALRQTDAANALIDMIELHRMVGASLYSLGWNALPALRTWVEEAANDAALQNVLTELGVKRTPDDLWGTEGIDLMLGQTGDEYLIGRGGNDLLSGDAGVDHLQGGAGNDVLDGGTGNDTLDGGDGNDVYLFGKGDGQDVVTEWGPTSGNGDMIRFKPDVLPSDVEIFREGVEPSSLVLRIVSTGDRITVQSWFSGADYRVERVEFADGTVWDEGTLAQAPIVGTADNDYLQGGAGDDVYLFGRGNGQDTITDYDYANGGGQDTIRLAADINPADVTLSRDAYSLYLGINGASDRLTVSNWYSGTNYRVERMVFADGTVWDATLLANAPYLGTDGTDYLYGTNDNETFVGGNGDDTLYGNGGNDALDGGIGDDTLQGGSGDDAYLFGRGYGQDTIYDIDYANVGGQDTIRLAADINPADVTLNRDAYSLYLGINGASDRLTVSNWYSGTNYRVERMEFADGTVWDATLLANAPYIGSGLPGSIPQIPAKGVSFEYLFEEQPCHVAHALN